MPRLSPDQRQQAIGRLDARQSVQQVARAFGVNVTTVYRLQQRCHANNSTCDLPGRGRPRVTTAILSINTSEMHSKLSPTQSVTHLGCMDNPSVPELYADALVGRTW
ncbi:hypothetical protein V1264_001420 [Littorina saxatilis]|uniref:Resolvase HTH domain-containing protein n=1 Tax=Littorina saxatilis TaxID=31220 RepID=A0AAN9GQV8_9CAEN